MTDIHFRKIEQRDNEELAGLIREVFREFHIDKPGTVYYDPTTDHLFEHFRNPGSVYWIAEEDRKIMGGCGIYPTQGLPDGCAELVKLYLLPGARGRGTGKCLMEKCFLSAKEMGYRQLYLETLPELGKAVWLYERAGFTFLPGPLGNSGHFGCTIWMLKNL
jgi:putative acetyltransferase